MPDYVLNWLAFPPFLTAFCSLALGLWIFLRESQSQLRRVLLFGLVCTAVWLGAFGFMYMSADAGTALMWARLAHLAIPLLPVCIYMYVTVGLRELRRDIGLVLAAVAVSVAFMVLAFSTRLVVADVDKHWYGYYARYGPAGIILLGYFALAIVLGLVKLRTKLSETARGSIFSRRISMSIVLGLVVAVTAVDFLPIFGVPVYPFGWAAVLVFLALIGALELRDRIVEMTPALVAEQVLRTMQGAVLVTSPRGRIELSNRAAAKLLGVDEPTVHRLSPERIFPSDEQWRSVLDDCVAGKGVHDLETTWRRGDGTTVEVSVSASMATGVEGRPLGVVLAAMDLTNRRRIQKQLTEREEQLRQSQKMEAIGQLAGGIAHDFNNLLTAIIGNSTLALTTMTDDDRHKPLVAEIHEVAERAAGLTRQILAFSRRQMLRPEVVCLNKVILDMESLLRRSLGEDVDLRLVLSQDLYDSEIDPHQIGQVLLNLVVNARDAMPDGGRLTVETANVRLGDEYCHDHRETTPGEYVMLAVTDTGGGMSRETQAHLFEPFFTTKGVGRGTGLGLSMVFGIVKQSGGSISVYSELGEGAVFKIYLPVIKGRTAPAPAPAGQALDVSKSSGSVLVVEDEAPVRRLVVRVLSQAGYQVKAAGSPKEATAIIETDGYRPDLLLTDVVLPGGMNGRQVADVVLGRFPDISVIFMSGYTRSAVVHDGRVDGDVAFLEKPFNPETLLRKVSDVLHPAPPVD
jgi:PAS domain S-box-containing protein